MTYRNKGLRGFLALLMAALMVLGMCGFGYAADALEDVEVDETILIDEPTITDDTAADEPTDADDAEADEPTDTDEAGADEPDEDDVEVVTQKFEEPGNLEITKTFESTDNSALPWPEETYVPLANFDVLEVAEDSNYEIAGKINVMFNGEEDKVNLLYCDENGNFQSLHSLSLAPGTYVLKETFYYQFGGYMFQSMQVKVNGTYQPAANNMYRFTIASGQPTTLEVKNVYSKPGNLKITHSFVDGSGKELPDPENTDDPNRNAYFDIYKADDKENTSSVGKIGISFDSGIEYEVWCTSTSSKGYDQMTLAPGEYKLKETTFRIVSGYNFDHWEVEGSEGQYDKDDTHTFKITEGGTTTLKIKNVYRAKPGTLNITHSFVDGSGKKLPDPERTDDPYSGAYFDIYKADATENTSRVGQIEIHFRDGREYKVWCTSTSSQGHGQMTLDPGEYMLKETIFRIVPGYNFDHWEVEGSEGQYGKDDTHTFRITAGGTTTLAIKNVYKEQFTVNYKLVKDGKETQYDTVTCNDGDSITLPPLPKVDGCTVIGWFEKDASEEPLTQAALGLGQYGEYVRPGTTIKVESDRTFYAYAMSSGTPVTYSAYLRINKVDEEGNPVAGAGFTMTNGQTSQGSAGRTDEQGQLLIGMLDVGDFTITETTVPEGYVAGEPVTVTVTSAHTRENPCTVTIVNAKSGAQPTGTPTGEPTATPAPTPSGEPTVSPTDAPSGEPTVSPTDAPSGEPTVSPTDAPSGEPTVSPTDAPSGEPTVSPADEPTARPTAAPTDAADGEDVPKTGDSGLGNLYALMCLSGLSAIALLLTHRRLRRS